MNGSEGKFNRVSPTSSIVQLKKERTPPHPYKSQESTLIAEPAKHAPVGNWATETWQPSLPTDKCPLPPIKSSLPACDTYEPTKV